MSEEKQPNVYLVFLRGQLNPLRLFSTVNLLESYMNQLQEREKGKKKWSEPITFVDDDDGEHTVAALVAAEIQGVFEGVVAPEAVIPDMLAGARGGRR